MIRRSILSALVAAAAVAGPAARAQDAEPSYFATPFPGWLQRVATGPDGTVYAAGVAQVTDLPGAIEPSDEPDWWYHPFVSAWAADGRLLWTRYLPFPKADGYPAMRAIEAAADGSAWVAYCGRDFERWSDDVCLVRLGADGAVLAAQLFGGTGIDRPTGLVLTDDGDVIVTGTTWSADFPVTTSAPGDFHSAAFVVRIRGDGTGVVWSQLLGTESYVHCTAAAPDGEGGVLAALATSLYGNEYDSFPGPVWSLTDLRVTRIAADGAVVESTPLPHEDSGTVQSLAAGADGSLLAAGFANYDSGVNDSFVMRVQPGSATVTSFWKERGGVGPVRIAVEPSGSVLVGTDLRFVSPYYSYWPPQENTSRLLRLTPDLREEATLLDRDGLRSITDFAMAPDGAVCVIGRGFAVTFNPVAPVEWVDDSFAARIPAGGAAPASAVEVVRTTRETTELAWSGGDSAASYEVELLLDSTSTGYTVAASAPGDARSVVVAGLAPGSIHTLRLVSVFRSGVRSAPPPLVVYSSPPRPSEFRATPTDRGVVLRWSPAEPAPNVRVEIQRRVNSGNWRRVVRSPWWPLEVSQAYGWFIDGLPRLGAGTVRYRIRSSLIETHGTSDWTYSDTVPIAEPSLRVRQTSGRIEAVPCSTGLGYIDYGPEGPPRHFELTGTFGATEDFGTSRFDPMRHDFRFWFGAPESPIGIRAVAGSWWWERTGSTWTWADYSENGVRCRLTIDPEAGTFSLAACTDSASDFGRKGDTVVVGFSYGNWSGGEIRRWSRVAGAIRPNLVLR